MKKLPIALSLILCIGLFSAFNLTKQDRKITETEKLDNALKEAKAANKLVFLDAYTSWCGWCKKLDKTTFADENVKAYLDSNFVILKMDMESSEGRQIGKDYRVAGYPTLLFLNVDKKLIHRIDGYVNAEVFLEDAKKAVAKK